MGRCAIVALASLLDKSNEPQSIEVSCPCFAFGAGAGGVFVEKAIDYLLSFANKGEPRLGVELTMHTDHSGIAVDPVS
jgi:hypothetical protein